MIVRKSIRLEGFDYRASYWYFVTVCTRYREEFFVSRICDKYGLKLSKDVAPGLVPANQESNSVTTRVAATNIVETVLKSNIPQRYKCTIDYYVFMPDHLHFIVALNTGDHKGRSYKLGEVIGGLKSLATRELWRIGLKGKVFQPNYYEHIVRDEASLDRIRNYIVNNPLVAYDSIPWKRLDPDV